MDKLRLIAGSGRSGTTWVLDAIADANNLRPVFEPLHPNSSGVAQEFGYSYLTRDQEIPDLKTYFESIANNVLRSVWTSYRIRPIRLRPTREHFSSIRNIRNYVRIWTVLARRRWAFRERESRKDVLVKCIRANLMLDWVHANFDARTVLLMRHPCAVVESQLRFPEHWDPYWLLSKYRKDAPLVEGPLRDRAAIVNRNFSRAQALTAIWCIENLVPALQARGNGYEVVFYEELLEQPEVEWPRIARGLGMPTVPGTELLQKPSQQSAVRLQKQGSSEDTYSQSHSSWRTRLPTAAVRDIDSVLQDFGVRFYKVSHDRPDVESFSLEFLSA